MKSTEIEAERVVSTSGLLTGRPNISRPRRSGASPRKANIRTFFYFLSLMYERQPLLCLHPSLLDTSPLSTPTLTSCGAHFTHNMQLPRRCTPHRNAHPPGSSKRATTKRRTRPQPLKTASRPKPRHGSQLRCHQGQHRL